MALIVFAAVISTASFSGWRAFEQDVESQRELLAGAATAYAAALSDAVADEDRHEADKVLRGIGGITGLVQADIRLPNGRVLTQMGGGAILVGRDGNPHEMSLWDLWQARQLRVEVEIRNNGSAVGQLGLLKDISELKARIVAMLQMTVLAAGLAILLALIASHWLIGRMTRPLRELTRQMAAFGADQAAEIGQIKAGRDETGLLAGAFNTMIASIRERDARLAHHMETLEDTVEERTHDLRVARDEAEAANAAKSDFLATMSHEIRTPMNGMLVMAEMLSAADLSARHRRYADIIARSGKSLLTIINDILDLSKIESGKLELETVPLSPDALVADVASLFWERARDKGLDLATYVAPGVPAEILGDGTRLNQVITNLVNNALKFTETGGVVIRLGARLSDDGTRANMVLEVEDTGIGIPEDKQAHIFEAFSQADQTTTRRFGGTGLGLAVCKRLVTAMGGEISVRSAEGKGSVFRAVWTAPVQAPAPAQPRHDGLVVGLDLGTGLSARWLAKALQDQGCRIGRDGADFILTTSARLEDGSRPPAPAVLVSDIGDTGADRLLQSGTASDLLAQPSTRADLADLLSRAAMGAWRGAEALSGHLTSIDRPSFAGLKVLAADDNAVNREVLREALATLGTEAVFVETGVEAVEAVAQGHYDLIFMDGSMPVMDGFEATRRIRALEAETGAARTPIHALTAQVAGTDAEAWRAAGADGHMTKPFTLDRLVSVLSMVGEPGKAPAGDPVEAPQETGKKAIPLLDPETLSTLSGLGPAVRGKVWSLFRAKAGDGVEEAARLIAETADRAEIARAAHAVKSMALSAGAARFAAACERLEQAAKDDTVARETFPSLLADLRSSLQASLTEMARLETPQAATATSASASSAA